MLRTLLHRALLRISQSRPIEQVPVFVLSKADSAAIFSKVRDAVALIRSQDPKALRRMQRSLKLIWIPGWHYVDAVYDPHLRGCILGANFVLSTSTSAAAIAGTLIHETTHARTWSPSYRDDAFVRARIERICYQAQQAFLARLPGGEELAGPAALQRDADPIAWSSGEMARRRDAALREAGIPRWAARLGNSHSQ
jgi:hypothetical protein